MIFLGLFLAGIAIGAIASMVGVGGGIFIVPLLAFFFVDTTQQAVGTSLAAIVFTSLSSTMAYIRQGVINFKLGLWLLPAAAVGAWLGAFATRFISSEALAVAFGTLLIYVAGIMLLGREPKEIAVWLRRNPDSGKAHYNPLAILIAGLAAGMAAGFFGIGGGIVMVPAMNLLLGSDIVMAVSTSLFVMGPSALIAAVQHWFQGNLIFKWAIPMALGIILGAQLGAFLATKVPKVRLRQLFGSVLLYSSINMIWKGITNL